MTDATEATGLDETDGVLKNNAMTGFSEDVSPYVQELSPEPNELNSRKPAYKVTFKALALASTVNQEFLKFFFIILIQYLQAIKRRVSTRADQEITRRTASEQQTEQQSDLSESLAADSFFSTSDELLGDIDDEFFIKPKPSTTPTEEVDYNLRKKGEIAYFDNKWTLRRQMSVKARGIPEQVIECEVALNCIFFLFLIQIKILLYRQ